MNTQLVEETAEEFEARANQEEMPPQWTVHTANLLQEIVKGSGQAIYHRPIQIFAALLFQVGERARELNDPKLNALMCRLTIYTCADPESGDYNPKLVQQVYAKEKLATIEAGAK